MLARAELEHLQGNIEQAIANYRRAMEQGVRSPRVIRQPPARHPERSERPIVQRAVGVGKTSRRGAE